MIAEGARGQAQRVHTCELGVARAGFNARYIDLVAWSVRAADGLAVALATKMPANAGRRGDLAKALECATNVLIRWGHERAASKRRGQTIIHKQASKRPFNPSQSLLTKLISAVLALGLAQGTLRTGDLAVEHALAAWYLSP